MQRRSNIGWLELVLGTLLVVLGINTFLRPEAALDGVVFAYALGAIVTGSVDVALYIGMERRTGFGPVASLIGGIFSLIVGILIVFHPGAGAWALTILFPIWFIAHCIARLCGLSTTKALAGTTSFVISLIANLIGLTAGILILFNPFASATALVYCVGFYLLLLGMESIVIAFSGMGNQA